MAAELAFEQLAKGILNFVNFGITILAIMLIWEGIRFIAGPKGGTAAAVGSRLTDWKKSPVLNAIKKGTGRYKTRLLNEYVQEQRETTNLGEAVKAAKEALAVVEKFRSAKELKNEGEQKELVDAVEKVEEHLKAVKRQYRRVNRATWRQERAIEPIIKKWGEAGKDTKNLMALENNLLRKHKEALAEVDKVVHQYEQLKGDLKAVKDQKSFPASLSVGTPAAPLNSPLAASLKNMQDNLQDELYELEDVYNKQVEIDKEVQGIISQVRPLWS